MAILTKDQILAAEDLKSELVDFSEWWGGEAWVRGLTGQQRDDYEASCMRASGSGRGVRLTPDFSNSNARLAVKCLVDADGKRIFADADAKALGEKSAGAISKCVAVVRRLSGMDEEAAEILRKNSLTGQSDDSTSD